MCKATRLWCGFSLTLSSRKRSPVNTVPFSEVVNKEPIKITLELWQGVGHPYSNRRRFEESSFA